MHGSHWIKGAHVQKVAIPLSGGSPVSLTLSNSWKSPFSQPFKMSKNTLFTAVGKNWVGKISTFLHLTVPLMRLPVDSYRIFGYIIFMVWKSKPIDRYCFLSPLTVEISDPLLSSFWAVLCAFGFEKNSIGVFQNMKNSTLIPNPFQKLQKFINRKVKERRSLLTFITIYARVLPQTFFNKRFATFTTAHFWISTFIIFTFNIKCVF